MTSISHLHRQSLMMDRLHLYWLELSVLVGTKVEQHVWFDGTSFESSCHDDTYTCYQVDPVNVELNWIGR